ncbi:MAG: efflux RND transporter periplasmic adaptor subunit [Planctomycetes bacterium]|nr:efflux RND transporter periplasmic adaptor subunit [Planctomycetota bacterium]
MRWRRGLLWAVAATLALAAVLWFLIFKPVQVVGHSVERGEVREEFPGVGSIEYERVAVLGFEVAGRITDIEVKQGDRVKAGQVLARIDTEVYRSEEAAAAENVEFTRASVLRLKADIARAQASHEGAKAHAKRQEAAFRTHSVSQDTLDQALERLAVTEAELARAEAALSEGERLVGSALKSLEGARARLARGTLISPMDGVLIARLAEPGDVAVTGGVILRVGDNSVVWASVWVDESFLAKLKIGQSARVVLRSDPAGALEAAVARIGQEVDRESRELVVDLLIKNAPVTLATGQRADASIFGQIAKDVTFVPASYILTRGGVSSVWVNDDGRASRREVETGLQSRERVEIKDGLKEGEQVIRPVAGAALTEGARVGVQEPQP